MTLSTIAFDQAIAETEHNRRHILLGNGFSIAAHSGFTYKSLAAEACKNDEALKEIFTQADTNDFERAMDWVNTDAEREHIRSALAETIAKIHPYRGEALTSTQLETCASFLSLFRRAGSDLQGRIFTVNYDALLYWVLMAFKSKLQCHDGFDHDNIWNPARVDRPSTSVFYLHGGLHIRKLIGRQPTGKLKSTTHVWTLVDQIRDHILSGNFPVMVAGRSRDEKVRVIRAHEDYLYPVFLKFHRTCRLENDVLFTYGHSLSAVDNHVADSIGHGKLKCAYISVFSDYDRDRVGQLDHEWSAFRASKGLPPLAVKMFDARGVPVWTPK